mmetsp:Transcript_7309/g.11015  ORF Transcript_7309/g.11015 Transcript_7309/m.11015 type:complete len:106 (+) Transcript_7309:818-1135(+)
MEIAPDDVLDPSAHLYDTTLYSMAGLLTIAFTCNALIRPVNPIHHLPDSNALPPPPSSPPPPSPSLSSSQSTRSYSTTTALMLPSRNLPQEFKPIDSQWRPFDEY